MNFDGGDIIDHNWINCRHLTGALDNVTMANKMLWPFKAAFEVEAWLWSLKGPIYLFNIILHCQQILQFHHCFSNTISQIDKKKSDWGEKISFFECSLSLELKLSPSFGFALLLSFEFWLSPEWISLSGRTWPSWWCSNVWRKMGCSSLKHDMKTNQNVNQEDALELLGLILIEKYVKNLRSYLVEEYVDGLLMVW